MSEVKLVDRLERVLRARGFEQDPDGTWLRPPDHRGQLPRARQEPGDVAAIAGRILKSRWGGGPRDDLRTVLYAHLSEYGWRVEGLRIRDLSGQLRQAEAALRDALVAGW